MVATCDHASVCQRPVVAALLPQLHSIAIRMAQRRWANLLQMAMMPWEHEVSPAS
jgi:hypothetical protein